jgi:hypothetical protein
MYRFGDLLGADGVRGEAGFQRACQNSVSGRCPYLPFSAAVEDNCRVCNNYGKGFREIKDYIEYYGLGNSSRQSSSSVGSGDPTPKESWPVRDKKAPRNAYACFDMAFYVLILFSISQLFLHKDWEKLLGEFGILFHDYGLF